MHPLFPPGAATSTSSIAIAVQTLHIESALRLGLKWASEANATTSLRNCLQEFVVSRSSRRPFAPITGLPRGKWDKKMTHRGGRRRLK
jgi:hypothetical protein